MFVFDSAAHLQRFKSTTNLFWLCMFEHSSSLGSFNWIISLCTIKSCQQMWCIFTEIWQQHECIYVYLQLFSHDFIWRHCLYVFPSCVRSTVQQLSVASRHQNHKSSPYQRWLSHLLPSIVILVSSPQCINDRVQNNTFTTQPSHDLYTDRGVM